MLAANGETTGAPRQRNGRIRPEAPYVPPVPGIIIVPPGEVYKVVPPPPSYSIYIPPLDFKRVDSAISIPEGISKYPVDSNLATIKPLGFSSEPTSPNTTGLGSQIKPLVEELFGSFGSEGVSGGAATNGNGKGIVSNIPVFVWIVAAVGLGYFLLKD